jgi:hypothetical protein
MMPLKHNKRAIKNCVATAAPRLSGRAKLGLGIIGLLRIRQRDSRGDCSYIGTSSHSVVELHPFRNRNRQFPDIWR